MIRLIHDEDVLRWYQLRRQLWPEHDENALQQEMLNLIKKPHTHPVFIYELPDYGIVAFIEASLREYVDGCVTGPVAYIEGLFVDRQFRRQGIAAKLVQQATRWAKQQNCKEIASDTVWNNRESQQVHQKLGFMETERIIIYRKIIDQ